jgi:HK97 family phage prohead protease
MTIEKRNIVIAELRASEDDSQPSIAGYAASFNILSADVGGFREVIAPGAFSQSLKNGADVRCLFNHDSSRVLGRSSAGTLKVFEDARGLKFSCKLDPDNSDHMNLRASILRGDVKECSFAFSVPPDGDSWDVARDENGNSFARRTLRNVNLLDVSPVTYPAYPAAGATEVQARAAAVVENESWARATMDRLNKSIEDSERRSKLNEIGKQLISDVAQSQAQESRGAKDWFAGRAAEACSAMGMDYCDHDEDYIYADDPDDEDEEACYRYEYSVDDETGDPDIDEDTEERCSHLITHEGRAAKRQRKADNELRIRMEIAAGRR